MRRFGVFAPLSKEVVKSRLVQWENQIGGFAERLIEKEPEEPKENALVGEIRQVLDSRMAKHSSEPKLRQHFTELFSGLETLTKSQGRSVMSTSSTAERLRDVLRPNRTESQILKDFDDVYFHGQADLEFTTRIVSDPRVKDIDHFIRAVSGGGTILRWSRQERSQFQLCVANKLWRDLSRRDEARAIVHSSFQQEWLSLLASDALNSKLLRQVVWAGAVVTPQTLISALESKVYEMGPRSLYVFWVFAVKTRNLDLEQLAAPLTGLSDSLQLIPRPLPPSLDFVPRKRDPELNIAHVIAKYAASSGNHGLQLQIQKDIAHITASSGFTDPKLSLGY